MFIRATSTVHLTMPITSVSTSNKPTEQNPPRYRLGHTVWSYWSPCQTPWPSLPHAHQSSTEITKRNERSQPDLSWPSETTLTFVLHPLSPCIPFVSWFFGCAVLFCGTHPPLSRSCLPTRHTHLSLSLLTLAVAARVPLPSLMFLRRASKLMLVFRLHLGVIN
jgi:hypothetical protein